MVQVVFIYILKDPDDLDSIKSSSKCFNSKYDIDIRTNGGNIIVPPTQYFNKNLNNFVKYKWENNIFDCELAKFPLWMKKILLDKNNSGNDDDNINNKKRKKQLQSKMKIKKKKKKIMEI